MRSIGVPSCVPLVMYTPRSSTRWSNRVDANTPVMNCPSVSRSAAICWGNAKARARRRGSPSSSTRSNTRWFSRASSRSNSGGNASATVPATVCSYGNVTPHTCCRPSSVRSSKYSVNPDTRSPFVTIR